MANPDIPQLERTKSVRFRPWIGEGYGKGNELGLPARLLILGESHYKWEGMPKLLKKNTEAVVQNYLDLDKGWGGRFFTKVVRTILGPDTAIEQKHPFFNSIAFCNYVQRIVGEGPRISPTPEMWKEAPAPFRATLECLRPTHIVALGTTRLWPNMPGDDGFWMDPPEALVSWLQRHGDGSWRPKKNLGCYRHSEGASIVLAIHHPSSRGFQPGAWNPAVKRFLKYDGSLPKYSFGELEADH